MKTKVQTTPAYSLEEISRDELKLLRRVLAESSHEDDMAAGVPEGTGFRLFVDIDALLNQA